MITTAQAVMSLRPDTEWSMNGDDVEGIIWHTPNVEPLTVAEVEAEKERLEQEAADKVIADAAAREALLERLGITEVEARLLLGGTA